MRTKRILLRKRPGIGTASARRRDDVIPPVAVYNADTDQVRILRAVRGGSRGEGGSVTSESLRLYNRIDGLPEKSGRTAQQPILCRVAMKCQYLLENISKHIYPGPQKESCESFDSAFRFSRTAASQEMTASSVTDGRLSTYNGGHKRPEIIRGKRRAGLGMRACSIHSPGQVSDGQCKAQTGYHAREHMDHPERHKPFEDPTQLSAPGSPPCEGGVGGGSTGRNRVRQTGDQRLGLRR